jgi:hypothetical protein
MGQVGAVKIGRLSSPHGAFYANGRSLGTLLAGWWPVSVYEPRPEQPDGGVARRGTR